MHSDSNDPDARKRLSSLMSPQHVDSQIRQAIQFCWMALPPEQQTVDEVENQMRRIFDRAIRDLREDAQVFGVPKSGE